MAALKLTCCSIIICETAFARSFSYLSESLILSPIFSIKYFRTGSLLRCSKCSLNESIKIILNRVYYIDITEELMKTLQEKDKLKK